MKQNEREIEGAARLFHISTKGIDKSIFISEDDYQEALTISAVCAFDLGITILAYCLMSNHVHFAVRALSDDYAARFIHRFKQVYSKCLNERHHVQNIFHRVPVSIKEITSVQYLKNCIAYILRNPLEAGIQRNADQYPWSSYCCYFRNRNAENCNKTAGDFSRRGLMDILKTHTDMKNCGSSITQNGFIPPETFIDSMAVEKLFGNSREELSKRIAIVNYCVMEYELSSFSGQILQDSALIKVASNLASEWFHKNLSVLEPSERFRLVRTLHTKYRANQYQICRVLGIDKKYVDNVLNTDQPNKNQ